MMGQILAAFSSSDDEMENENEVAGYDHGGNFSNMQNRLRAFSSSESDSEDDVLPPLDQEDDPPLVQEDDVSDGAFSTPHITITRTTFTEVENDEEYYREDDLDGAIGSDEDEMEDKPGFKDCHASTFIPAGESEKKHSCAKCPEMEMKCKSKTNRALAAKALIHDLTRFEASSAQFSLTFSVWSYIFLMRVLRCCYRNVENVRKIATPIASNILLIFRHSCFIGRRSGGIYLMVKKEEKELEAT